MVSRIYITVYERERELDSSVKIYIFNYLSLVPRMSNMKHCSGPLKPAVHTLALNAMPRHRMSCQVFIQAGQVSSAEPVQCL